MTMDESRTHCRVCLPVIEKHPVDKSCGCSNTDDDDDKATIYEALTVYSRHYAYYVIMYVISFETQGL